MGGIFFSKILASFFLLKASNFKPWTCGNFTLKQKNLIYFSAKFGGIKPRIVHVCRASDRVGGKKINILWDFGNKLCREYLELYRNCARL